MIGQLACVLGESFAISKWEIYITQPRINCFICDPLAKYPMINPDLRDSEMEQLFSLMGSLLRVDCIQSATKPRIAAMLALKRLLLHTGNLNHLDLSSSPFGKWCMMALRSSLRDLRIAAGLVHPRFRL